MACEGHHSDGTSLQRSAPSGLKNFPSTNWGSKVAIPKHRQPSPGMVTRSRGGLLCPLSGHGVCVPWIQPFPGAQRSPWCLEVSGPATLQPPIPEDKRFHPASRSADIFSECSSPAPPGSPCLAPIKYHVSSWPRCIRAAV